MDLLLKLGLPHQPHKPSESVAGNRGVGAGRRGGQWPRDDADPWHTKPPRRRSHRVGSRRFLKDITTMFV